MTQAEKWNMVTPIILISAIALIVTIYYRQYQKNKAALASHQNAVIVSPSRLKFLFSWFAYFLFFFIPTSLFFWVIESEHQMFWVYLFVMPLGWLINAIPAYPFYTLSIYDNKLEGARLWGLSWQRTEMDFSKIDKEKTLRQNFLQKLGIILFHSINGKKILTFGLDDLQMSQVFKISSYGKD
jgi:hypothetical protein